MRAVTLLWRQVHPHWIQKGRVTSQAFRPSRKDGSRLSVDDCDQISVAGAYCLYAMRFRSVGVLAVSVEDCEPRKLVVAPDPHPERPSHTVVDFSELSRGEINRAAEHLRDEALRRGWTFSAPE